MIYNHLHLLKRRLTIIYNHLHSIIKVDDQSQ